MAGLGQIPPWLDVKPSDFVRAAAEGAQAGMQVAHMRQQAAQFADQQAAQEAARSQALAERQAEQQFRAWEANERMRVAAERYAKESDLKEKSTEYSHADRAARIDYERERMKAAKEKLDQEDALKRELSGNSIASREKLALAPKQFAPPKPPAPQTVSVTRPIMGPNGLPVIGAHSLEKVPRDQFDVESQLNELKGSDATLNPGNVVNPSIRGLSNKLKAMRSGEPLPASTIPDTSDLREPPPSADAPVIPTGESDGVLDTVNPDFQSPAKVRVKNPSGKWGMIPADQLDAALQSGYSTEEAPPETPEE